MEHESFEDAGDRGADERALRERQGRPGGAARPRRRLHGGGGRADRPGRLADDGLPHARRASRSTAGRTTRPSRGTGCRASGRCSRRSPRRGATAATTSRPPPRSSSRPCGTRPRCEPSKEPLTDGLLSARRARTAQPVRPPVGRLGAGAEVPERAGARVPAAPRRRATALGDGHDDARRDGGWRHVRPARRRLPPLLGRRPLARPALREDALRQRAARPRVPARVARHRQRALPRDLPRDRRVHAPRARRCRRAVSPRRRTPTPTASRASRSRGRRRRACRRSCSSRSSTGARSSAVSSTPELRARLFEEREQRPKPLRDDKAIASWNGLALAALAEAGRRLDEPDWIDAAAGLGEFLLGAALDDDGPPAAQLPRGAHERRRATSTTTRTSRTACSSCTSRPASCAGSRRRTGSRGSRSSSSPTRSAAASSWRIAIAIH